MAQKHEAGLVICVTGPESTGKTTLAVALAAALGAPLVEEAARAMLTSPIGRHRGRSDLPIAIPIGVHRGLETAPTGPNQRYTREDVLEIARAQLAAEASALAMGAPVIVADTDLTVIRVWWEEKYGDLDPWIEAELARRSPRCYLLALPDIPWEPDPLRESPHDRDRLLERYRSVLQELAAPYAEIEGAGAMRLERALAQVREWLRESPLSLPGS